MLAAAAASAPLAEEESSFIDITIEMNGQLWNARHRFVDSYESHRMIR
jgi:ligand-binding SRPBCC domain-containing protein